MKALHLLTH